MHTKTLIRANGGLLTKYEDNIWKLSLYGMVILALGKGHLSLPKTYIEEFLLRISTPKSHSWCYGFFRAAVSRDHISLILQRKFEEHKQLCLGRIPETLRDSLWNIWKKFSQFAIFSEADYPTNALSCGPLFYFFHQLI